MAYCWEEHNRFIVRPEDMGNSECIATADGLALMVHPDPEIPFPLAFSIMPEEQLAPGFSGELFAHRITVARHHAEALQWFEQMCLTRPWEARQ